MLLRDLKSDDQGVDDTGDPEARQRQNDAQEELRPDSARHRHGRRRQQNAQHDGQQAVGGLRDGGCHGVMIGVRS